jgi:Family of unknown function (DUF5681)
MGTSDDWLDKVELEQVGYRNPPKHSQFRKGQSGNPKGRPKGSKNVQTLLSNALYETVYANVNGRPRKITKVEAMIMQLVNNAARGDYRSIALLLNKFPDLAPDLTKPEKKRGGLSPEAVELFRKVLLDDIYKQ